MPSLQNLPLSPSLFPVSKSFTVWGRWKNGSKLVRFYGLGSGLALRRKINIEDRVKIPIRSSDNANIWFHSSQQTPRIEA